MKHGKGSKKTAAAKKSPAKSSRKAEKKQPAKVVAAKSSAAGRGPARAAPAASAARSDGRGVRTGPVNFSNTLVANAFRRAVKKYAAAFKRLTD